MCFPEKIAKKIWSFISTYMTIDSPKHLMIQENDQMKTLVEYFIDIGNVDCISFLHIL
eukprot:UN10914